jgi:Tfp pilus assembly protein PilF
MNPPKIKQSQLIQVFKDLKLHQDEGMCFLLGAGASVTSNIPSGGQLAWRWYEEIKKSLGDDLPAWQKAIGFDESRVAEFYPQIFEQRFKNHPSTGFYYLQDCMKEAEPSVGYSFLAQILAKTQHKFVITTNFDHMVEDAIRTYTDERPLVCGHESLAQYINARSIRPTIIKVHRDLLLNPFNNSNNTAVLDAAWKLTLEPILQHYHLVVIGYGGNDGSLMKYLQDIKRRKGVYWCYRNMSEINDTIRKTLKQADDRLVEISGFDELMLALNSAFDYPKLINPDKLAKSPFVKTALAKAKRYKAQLDKFAEDEVNKSQIASENDGTTREALLKLFDLDEDKAKVWWKIQLKIDEEKDTERKLEMFNNGLLLLPEDPNLFHWYALFLMETRRDYDQAEAFFKKALDLAPNKAKIKSNYAFFLEYIRKDYKQAENFYQKALELDPKNKTINNDYAVFGNYNQEQQPDSQLKNYRMPEAITLAIFSYEKINKCPAQYIIDFSNLIIKHPFILDYY